MGGGDWPPMGGGVWPSMSDVFGSREDDSVSNMAKWRSTAASKTHTANAQMTPPMHAAM